MNRGNKFFLFTAVLLLIIGPGYAQATPIGTFTSELNPTTGQTFYGDGAVYSNGYLQAPTSDPTGDKCLQCHANKGTYLKTGHGNMVVNMKLAPAGSPWKGANLEAYPTDNVGHPIDWATGKVNLGGTCSVTGFEGQFEEEACIAKGGTWAAGDRWVDLIYTIGGWMTVDAPDVGIMDATGTNLPANTFYMGDGRTYGTCGSCHNAGYLASDYTRPQPFGDYSNLPRSSAAGFGGSWVLDGIQCERCHDASNHPTNPQTNPTTVPSRTNSTALCSQCHIRAGAWEYAVIPPASAPAGGPPNPDWATQPTAYPIGASATNFGGHLIGKQFLNSPHGLFTGTYGQIADTSLYGTHFNEGGICSIPEQTTRTNCENAGGTWTRFTGGCATCHDVHQSTVPEAKANFGAEPIKRECGIACHTGRADLSTMRHPTGAGTPFEQSTAESCVICHMPKPAGGTGLNVHVFRINTDPTYSTFPAAGATTPGICSNPSFATTKAACTDANTGGYCYDTNNNRLTGITNKADCVSPNKWKAYTWSLVANSAPEGEFENAVWVDIDLACGQCHGDNGTAHSLSKRTLAGYAVGMHQGTGTAISCSDCHASTAAAHPAGAGTPTDCAGCHGARAGVMPTVETACITCHGPTGSASHQFTAEQLTPFAEAIHRGGSAPSTSCTDCHTEIPPSLINHPIQICTNCHSQPGVRPTFVEACNSCHGPGGSTQSIPAETLAKLAPAIHKNVAPVAAMEITPADLQVPPDTEVQVTDTSTDANENIVSITVKWGDGGTDTMGPGESVRHVYAKSGAKTISLTAIDEKGLKSTVKQKITILKTASGQKQAKKKK